MRQILVVILLFMACDVFSQDDRILLSSAKFNTGEDNRWATTFFDDASWKTIPSNNNWEGNGFDGYDGYAWYRFHFVLPSSLRERSFWKDSIRIFLSKIDDADEVYLNGSLIAKHGSFPSDVEGYSTAWNQQREIHLSSNNPFLQWDKENLLAVKVYDGGGPGGIFGSIPFVNMMDIVDEIRLSAIFEPDGYGNSFLQVSNMAAMQVKGLVKFTVTNTGVDSIIQSGSSTTTIAPNGVIAFTIRIPQDTRTELKASFTEANTGKSINFGRINNYILTPPVSRTPRINGASVFGVRPKNPFLFKVAATGEKPLQYEAANLPPGLRIDKSTGIITGSISSRGDFKVLLTVKNKYGTARKDLMIKCGDLLALTPPMGWNSWNCWGLSVSDAKVRASADAMINKGLVDHGWAYINIDDGWEALERNPTGEIISNEKFTGMKELGDWLHGQGLKFGIYSSPGPKTCGGYLGSYQHEIQDANTYSDWGIDYLKYDWCSYGGIHGKDTTLESYMKPYQVMENAIRSTPRDIIYSLCQYGMKNVWQWGDKVDGNCWRTTGDIEDTWESLKEIGFNQDKMSGYARPGRWNDPDMLIVGMVGWGENLHPTRLTPDEQYTHISLWSLLSAPLLIGCDMSRMDAFTLNLLTNDEIISIDQDPLGKQATRIVNNEVFQVWVKTLSDGSRAIGLFNISDIYQQIAIPKKELGLTKPFKLYDCWRQKNLGIFTNYSSRIPPHGVLLLRLR